MRRRALLRSAAALLPAVGLAGCFMERPPTELRLVPAADDRLVSEFARPADEFPPELRALVSQLLDEGEATRTESGSPRLSDGTVIRADGAFHEVRTTFVRSVRREGYTFDVRRADDETDDEADEQVAETVSFAELPPTDRAAFRAANPDRLEPGIGTGVFVEADEFDPSESTFAAADGIVVVRYEGDRYRVGYGGPQTREDEQYRYEVDVVADSPAAFVAHLESRYLFELDGSLSTDQRDIVDAAIVEDEDADGYTEDDDLSDAFRSLIDLLADREALDRGYGDGEWLCTYDGTRYVATVEHAPEDVLPDPDRYRTTEEPTTGSDSGAATGTIGTTGTTTTGGTATSADRTATTTDR